MMATDEGLVCSICMDKFREPKIIPCFHTFCCHCLQQHITRRKRDGKFLCPVCRKATDIPTAEAKGFQSNFYIAQVPTQVPIIPPKPLVRRGNGDGKTFQDSKCGVHPGEEIVIYCKQCRIPCCRDCKIDSHDGHPSTKLSEMWNRLIPTAENLVAEAAESKGKIEQYEIEINASLQQLKHDNARLKTAILQKKLETNRKAETAENNALKSLYDETQIVFNRIKKAQEKLQASSATLTHVVENLIEKSTVKNPLQIFTAIRDAKADLNKARIDVIVSHLYPGMEIQMLDQRDFAENEFGKVMMNKLAPALLPELKAVSEVQFTSTDKRLFVKAMLPVSITEAWLALRSSKVNDSRTVLWKINVSGEILTTHYMKEGVNSLALFKDGSVALSFPFENKISILNNDQNFSDLAIVKKPLGMALFDEKLYVCSAESPDFKEIKECEINRVLVLSRNGLILQSIEFDDGKPLFSYPGRIGVNYNGDICVSDFAGFRIRVLANDGKPRTVYSGMREGEQMLCGEVDCDQYGRVIVESNSGIDILDKDGVHMHRYSCIPADRIAAMAVGSRGKLWIVTVDLRFKVVQYVED